MEIDPDIYLAPCSRTSTENAYRYLQETVLDGVSPEDYPEIEELGFNEKVPVWGVVESNKSYWEQVRPGIDIVLFYSKPEVYTHLAVVDKKVKNADLADKVWEGYEGTGVVSDPSDPWEYMMFLHSVERVDIPSDDVHNALEYEKMEYPMGFMRPADKRQNACRNKYESIFEFLNESATKNKLDQNAISDSIEHTKRTRHTSPRRKRSNDQNDTDSGTVVIEFEQDISEIQDKDNKHEKLLDVFEEKLNADGYKTFETEHSDLIGIDGDSVILAEAKTIENNESDQIRSAIGQLIEYRYSDIQLDDELNNNPLMFLVLDQKPNSFYLDLFTSKSTEDIHLIWIEDEEVKTPSGSIDLIDKLV